MSESQAEAESDAGHLVADGAVEAAFEAASPRCGGDYGTGSRSHGRLTRRGGGLRMLAVTPERLAVAESLAGIPGYLPAIPADSEDRSFD
jgi:hypothetical protein